MTTLAGTTYASNTSGMSSGCKREDGDGAVAHFCQPVGLVVDAAENVFVVDRDNESIRKITPAGVVSTLAGSSTGRSGFVDGRGGVAAFFQPSGLALDASGNLFVADEGNRRLRKIAPDGLVTTLSGSGAAGATDGDAASASFDHPVDIAFGGGKLLVADDASHRIRKVGLDGEASTLAGSGAPSFVDGAGTAAGFDAPHGIGVSAAGDVFVADTVNRAIRRIRPDGLVVTLGASETTGLAAVESVAVDSDANLLVADGHCIRRITTGIGAIAVSWRNPEPALADLRFTATATAGGHAVQTCEATGATTCTIHGLLSGVP